MKSSNKEGGFPDSAKGEAWEAASVCQATLRNAGIRRQGSSIRPCINRRLASVFLCSILMHLAALLVLVLVLVPGQGGMFQHGLSHRDESPGAQALAVYLVPRRTMSAQPAIRSTQAQAAISGKDLAMKPKETPAVARPLPQAARVQGFVPAGRLTRRPSPVGIVDLDVAAIDEVAVGGEVELTVFVDEDGSVVDVSATTQDERAQVFADRVAARFRFARFTPGEVDGIPVRSEWHVAVVSERR